MAIRLWGLHNRCMLDVHAVKNKDLLVFSHAELAQVAAQMLAHIGEQSTHISGLR